MFVAASIGFIASITGHLLSFHPAWAVAPGWYIAVMLGIFPIGWVGIYVCMRVDHVYGVRGADKQWAFFDEHLPKWLIVLRTGFFFCAIARFAWFAISDISGSPPDDEPPLGLFSAFGMIMYLASAMILHVGLEDPELMPSTSTNLPSQSPQ